MPNLKEVSLERTYGFPLHKVWEACTDSEKIKKWWGPDNVIIPECEIDLRVGGIIRIVMEAGEGMGEYKGIRWPMLGKFTVIESHSKIAYDAKAWTEGQEEVTTIEQSTEISFKEEGNNTKMNIKAVVHKIGPGAKMAIEGMEWGFKQQFDKLEKYLAK